MLRIEKIIPLIEIVENEVGYLSKKTNSYLDDKYKNAGKGNYTKYWRDVKREWQGQPWDAAFVSWCFMKTYGRKTAEKLLKHWPYTYCPDLGELFKKYSTPLVGDIVIFYKNGTFSHTGIVVAVDSDKFTTVEGNTSSAPGIISNGDSVCKKTYQNSKLPGTKFCRPDYSNIVKTLSERVFIVGNNYELTTNLLIRETPAGASVMYEDVSKTAQRRSIETSTGKCKLKKGTIIRCREVEERDGSVWIRTLDGWIAGNYNGTVRLKATIKDETDDSDKNDKPENDIKKYKVQVASPRLHIRERPTIKSDSKGYTGKGTFTIIEERKGKDGHTWGKLSSGIGWIPIDFGCVKKK